MVTLSASKMQSLHSIMIGETTFKNKALLKVCNVELMFGAKWQQEYEAFTKTLPAPQMAVAKKQLGRLLLTSYTTRELSMYAGNGPNGIKGAAEGSMLCEGVGMLKSKGEAAFVAAAQEEGKLANWTTASINEYISKVKAAKA